MKKYFVVADVHGFYDEMCKALADAGYDKTNPDHVFVSLGDLFDRGPAAKQCLEFVNSLPNDNKILILGNHELLMQDMIERGFGHTYDINNGTIRTARDLTEIDDTDEAIFVMKHFDPWKEYLYNCQFYAEVGDNIFVHGWIPCYAVGEYNVSPIAYDLNWRNASIREWKDATWINGMAAWANGIKEPGKTIWCGHWHTSWGHANLHHYGVEFPKKKGDKAHFSPFKDDGIVAMDACTVYSHKVNCEVITF